MLNRDASNRGGILDGAGQRGGVEGGKVGGLHRARDPALSLALGGNPLALGLLLRFSLLLLLLIVAVLLPPVIEPGRRETRPTSSPHLAPTSEQGLRGSSERSIAHYPSNIASACVWRCDALPLPACRIQNSLPPCPACEPPHSVHASTSSPHSIALQGASSSLSRGAKEQTMRQYHDVGWDAASRTLLLSLKHKK